MREGEKRKERKCTLQTPAGNAMLFGNAWCIIRYCCGVSLPDGEGLKVGGDAWCTSIAWKRM